MNRTEKENSALQDRVMFETKHALASANFEVVEGFLNLAREIGVSGPVYEFYRLWGRHKWDLSIIYKWIKF